MLNEESVHSELENSLTRGRQALSKLQNSDGSWVGEVDLNPGPTAQVVMLYAAIQRQFPDQLKKKALAYILRTQNIDGGWSPYFDAKSEVSLTCECYVAMRLLGLDADSESCRKAMLKIKNLGGVGRANPWTHLYMSVLGIVPWKSIHRTPIDTLMTPDFLPFSIGYFSYWVKAITVPMSLLGYLGPGKPIVLASQITQELDCGDGKFTTYPEGIVLKYIYPYLKKLSFIPTGLKGPAVRKAWRWIESFTEESGDFGGNTCTAINVILCYYLSGKTNDPAYEKGICALLSYAIEDENEWRVQTCQSHVWDTGFSLMALASQTKSTSSDLSKGISWLRDRQILNVRGEWSQNVNAEPGGWCFGNRHDHYPVTDCTAMALLAIARHSPELMRDQQILKGIDWLLAMQHQSGGWSAYEKYRGAKWVNKLFTFKDIPNALSDVPKADVSAKVIEALVEWREFKPDQIQASLEKARQFLLATRDENQLWRGNYGINYIYGTAFSCKALRAIDEKASVDWSVAPRELFLKNQNDDGGWGEVEESYQDSELAAKGPSSPVQTAWALLGLCAASDPHDDVVLKAVKSGMYYLLKTQKSNGFWHEPKFLGTVFPGMVYFRYTYYPMYFPLMALSECKNFLKL